MICRLILRKLRSHSAVVQDIQAGLLGDALFIRFVAIEGLRAPGEVFFSVITLPHSFRDGKSVHVVHPDGEFDPH